MLALLSFAAHPDRASGGTSFDSKELVVYTTSNTDGKVADPRCRETPILTPDRLSYAHQVSYWRRLAPRLRARDDAFAPVALHLGDSSYPGPLGRYLLTEGRDGARLLARILSKIPYVSHTLGNRELGLQRGTLNALAEGAIAEQLPLRAANIVCTPQGGSEAVCDATGQLGSDVPYDVVERGDLRLLFVSVVDPEIRNQIAPTRLTGLDILDPSDLLERRIEEIRQRSNADLVFAQYHAASETAIERLVEFSRAVPQIDVISTNRQLAPAAGQEETENNGYVRTPGTGAYIVPAGRSSVHASVTRLGLAQTTGDDPDRGWTIRDLETETVDTRSGPPDPATSELLWQASEELCQNWGEPIDPEAPFAEPFDRGDFIAFSLDVMRHAGRAEIAVMNDGAVLDEGYFPLRGRLTLADVYTLLPFGNPMVVLRIRGEALRAIAGGLEESVRARGLEVSGTRVLVNGRPIRDDRIYSVATNRFVAEGGDGIIETDDIRERRLFDPDWSAETPSISDTVVQFVASGRYVASGQIERRLSPEGVFPDLHRRLLWSIVGSINASYNQVGVTNPTVDDVPVYNQSQLRVQPTQQLHLEGALQANADSENHEWDSSLLVQYALARVDSGGNGGGLEETSDIVRGKSRYKYAGIRSTLGNPWWGPMPSGELQIETEIGAADDRSGQRFELTGIVGSAFELSDALEVRAGVDIRRDLNTPGASIVYGVTGAYQLNRTTLAELFGAPIEVESELEYFFNDPFAEQIHELRTTSRLFFSVYEDLHLTTTFSAFLFRSGFVGTFGRNTALTMGLNYRWDEAIQTF